MEAIKAEMRECVSRVTRGRALLELAAVFQVRAVHGKAGGSCRLFSRSTPCPAVFAHQQLDVN